MADKPIHQSVEIEIDGANHTVTRAQIAAAVGGAIADFLYYDRKEDKTLPRTAIQKAVKAGLLTEDELVEMFRAELSGNFE